MTIYFRPDRIEYSYPTTAQESFNKDDHEIFDITLSIQRIIEEKTTNLISYGLDQVNRQFLHRNHFIGLSAKGDFLLQVNHKSELKQRQTKRIDFKEQISKFKGCKNDLFTKEIQIGNYRISCTYGYNKFLEVCGMSKFYQFTIEPPGILSEKVKKIKNDTLISASKRLLNRDDRAQRQVMNMRSQIKEKKNTKFVEPNTAIKEDKVDVDENEHSKVVFREGQSNLFAREQELQLRKKPQIVKGEALQDLKFYKGPCKTANFFSCLDPRPNVSKQYNFIQQSYD